MCVCPKATWYRLFGWLALGVVIYLAYGMRHSRLAQTVQSDTHLAQELKHVDPSEYDQIK